MDKTIAINIKNTDNTTSTYYINWELCLQYQDYYEWGIFDNQRYWEKYPHTKPEFNNKVILDESDKWIR